MGSGGRGEETGMPTRRGFTLVELLLVVMLLGLIAALVLPRLAYSGDDARKATCASNIRIINAQIEFWTVTNGGQYPDGGGQVEAGGIAPISRYYVGAYPSNDSEFQQKVLNNPDIFPDGPPQCPYGQAYEYDPSTKRVKPHSH
jgi:prepilin-type N-terminal cleavage/methylation domain-containing protein